jgi:hypothetical protein
VKQHKPKVLAREGNYYGYGNTYAYRSASALRAKADIDPDGRQCPLSAICRRRQHRGRSIKGPFSTVTVSSDDGFATSRAEGVCAQRVVVTHREAKLMLPITQIATAATSPALANTPDTATALNRITPNAYAILSSTHRITPMKRPNTQ